MVALMCPLPAALVHVLLYGLFFAMIGHAALDDLWPSYRFNSLNAGSKSVVGPQDNSSFAPGSANSVGYTASACVTSQGIAIIGDLNAVVRAFDVNSMVTIWSSDNMYGNGTDLNLGTYMSSSPTLSLDEKEVYITTFISDDVAIYSLDPLTGLVNWFKVVENKETAFSSVAIYKEIVLVAFDEQIYAFHTTDKEADQDEQQEHYHPGWIAWIYNSTIVGGSSNVNKIQSTLAIDEENGFAYFGTGIGKSIVCLDLKANATTNYTNIDNDVNDASYVVDNSVWSFNVNGRASSSGALDLENKLLYFVAADGLHCLTLKDPYLANGIVADTQSRLLYYLDVPTGGLSSAALSLDLERVVIATSDRRVISVDVTVLHTINQLGGFVPGTNDSMTYNESNTASVMWEFSVDANVQISSPVLDAQNNIYVATQRGTIYGIASNSYLASDLKVTTQALDERAELLWKFESDSSGGIFSSAVLISNERMLFSTLSGILGFETTPPPASPPSQGSTSSLGAFGSGNTAILISGLLIFLALGVGLWLFFAFRRKQQSKDIDHHRLANSGTPSSSSNMQHSVTLIKGDGNKKKDDATTTGGDMMASSSYSGHNTSTATIGDSSSYMRSTTSSKSTNKPPVNATRGGLPPNSVYKSPYHHGHDGHGLPPRSGIALGSLEANNRDNSDDGLDSPSSSVSSLTFNESSKVLPPLPGHVHFRYNAQQQEGRHGNTLQGRQLGPPFAVIGTGLHGTINASDEDMMAENRKRSRRDASSLKDPSEGLADGRHVIPSTVGDDLELGHGHSHSHPHAMNVLFAPAALPTTDVEDENTVDTPHPSAPVKPLNPVGKYSVKQDADMLSTVVEGTDTSVTTESLLSTQIVRPNVRAGSLPAVLPSRSEWKTASLKSPEREKMKAKAKEKEEENDDLNSIASSTVVMDDQDIIAVANQGQPVRVVMTSKLNKESLASSQANVGTVLTDIPAVLTPPSSRSGQVRSSSHSRVPITDTDVSRTDSSRTMPSLPPPNVPTTIGESSSIDDTSLPNTSRWFDANSDTVLLQSISETHGTTSNATTTPPILKKKKKKNNNNNNNNQKAAPTRGTTGSESIRQRALELERMLHLSRPIATRTELDPGTTTIGTSAPTGNTATALAKAKSEDSFEVDIDFDSVGL